MRSNIMRFLTEKRQTIFLLLVLLGTAAFAYRGMKSSINVRGGRAVPFLLMSDDARASGMGEEEKFEISRGRADWTNSAQTVSSATAYGGGGPSASNTTSSFHVVTNYNETTRPQEKIIKNATVECRVEKFQEATQRFLELIRKYGGRTDKEEQDGSGGEISGTIVARVSAEKFDSLLNELVAVSVYTESKTISAEDITEQFVDHQTRLAAKRSVEHSLLSLLVKANKVSDMVEIETKLGEVREEIESLEGRLRFWQDQVSFSTITLNYSEKTTNANLPPEETFSSRFGQSLKNGWAGFVDFLLSLLANWAMWLLIIAFCYGGWKWLQRIERKKKEAKNAEIHRNDQSKETTT